MEQKPSGENNTSSFSGSRNSPHLSYTKFRSQSHKRLPPVPFLSHNNTAHGLTFCWVVTLMLSSRICLGLPSGHFPSFVTSKILHAVTLCPMPVTCPTSLICRNLINWIAIGEGTDHDTLLYVNYSLTVYACCRLRQIVCSNNCPVWSCCVVASLWYLLHNDGLFVTVTDTWRS